MISINIDNTQSFIDENNYNVAIEKAKAGYNKILDGTGAGNEWLGWRRILKIPELEEINQIKQLAARFRQDADVFIVCGIGGSYLGSRAVIDALNGLIPEEKPEIIYAGHQISGRYLEQLIEHLNKPNNNGKDKSVYLNVISKSGSTLETALAFRVLRRWFEERYGEESSERIIATTGPAGGVLNKLIDQKEYRKFVIPDDVGGRFSVLTAVGLLPIAVAGIDILALFDGAVSKFLECEQNADDILEYAALRYHFHETGKAIDVIGTFEPDMNSFTGWIQQLLGESEGKEGKGIFPVNAAYSTDLHSIGQMIQQGKRNLIESILVIEENLTRFEVRESPSGSDELDYLTGKLFHEINCKALEGTIEAHAAGGVPVIRIQIQKLNAHNLGELIYFYELFTAVYVYMLQVNPFNQPGVEDYKKAMYRNLGKK